MEQTSNLVRNQLCICNSQGSIVAVGICLVGQYYRIQNLFSAEVTDVFSCPAASIVPFNTMKVSYWEDASWFEIFSVLQPKTHQTFIHLFIDRCLQSVSTSRIMLKCIYEHRSQDVLISCLLTIYPGECFLGRWWFCLYFFCIIFYTVCTNLYSTRSTQRPPFFSIPLPMMF